MGLLLVGAGLWGVYRLARPPVTDRIEVREATVAALREDFTRREGRPPTVEESEALVSDWVEREVLVREALAQGLDRADPIVRRRLVQKMRFVLEESGPLDDPGDDALAEFVEAHIGDYRRAPRRGFVHVFVAGSAEDARAEASRWVQRLEGGEDPQGQGDAFAHGTHQSPAERDAIARRYGDDFAQAVEAAAVGRWFPARSSFGWHAVQVDAERPGAVPPLAQIRARVLADWQRQQRRDNRRRGVQALVDRYDVEVSP